MESFSLMKFLDENFQALKDLKNVSLQHSNSSPPKKSTVIPMPVLLRDEKYIDEAIQILHDYKRECNLTGDPEVNYVNVVLLWLHCNMIYMNHSGVCG